MYKQDNNRSLSSRKRDEIVMLMKNAAIIYNGDIILYHDLLKKINSIISLLHTKIIEKSVIGIAMHRKPELILTMFAVIYIKTPFVLIDIELPSDRFNQIINTANITTIITTKDIDIEWNNCNKVYVEDAGLISFTNLISFKQNEDIVYVLFTSGSTCCNCPREWVY